MEFIGYPARLKTAVLAREKGARPLVFLGLDHGARIAIVAHASFTGKVPGRDGCPPAFARLTVIWCG